MKKYVFVVSLLFLSHLSLPANAAFQCVKAQSAKAAPVPLDRFSSVVMRIIRMMVSDPTKLRMEIKGVVNSVLGRAKIQELADTFGSQFSLREGAKEGTVNVTARLYANIAKYMTPSGVELSTKLRFRRYFSQKISDVWRNAMNPAESFEKQAMMEIKIQHPDYQFVVVKLRVKVLLNDIMTLSDSSFLGFKTQLHERILKLNPGNTKEVNFAMEYLEALYNNPARMKEYLYGKTEYERDSYSIKIPHATIPGKKIEVQITADTKVRITRLIDQQDFPEYTDDQIIYELKIPLEQSKLTEKDFLQYPGLRKIAEFKQWLQGNHDTTKPFNRGKISKLDRNAFRLVDDRREARDMIYDFLVRIGWLD